ncbi:MAG: hypothetical protein JWQ07_4758 [Ramlibacter sp.]|nr:hypothetical protein [Ramlibacter sp.]
MTLRPIDEHCAVLSEALVELGYWSDVSEWLMAGASIESVEVDSAKFDRSGGMCNDYGYGDAKDALFKLFVQAFSVFSLVWGALEATLDAMNLPPHPDRAKRGKISDACYFLHKEFESRTVCLGLKEEIESFRRNARECLGFDRVESRYLMGRDFGIPAIGLFIVYELRNQFAHGSLVFPTPNEEYKPESAHHSLVSHATRIVLMQLQMLVIAHSNHSTDLGEYFWYESEDDEDGCNTPLSVALGTLQFSCSEEAPQLLLFPYW